MSKRELGTAPPRGWVNLRCPKCERVIRAAADKTDPPNTATVEAPCTKCDNPGDRPETMYFDSADRQLNPETGEPLTTKQHKQEGR